MEQRKITRSDLVSMFLRSNLQQASFNFERIHGLGFCYDMIPAIKRLYPLKEDQVAALRRHLVFFNTTPAVCGPVIGVTTFKDEAEALEIANQTQFGLGAGVWTRDSNLAYRMGRGIKAGRVWTNCYHVYPAHAAFGGYKQSGVGRETHKMALDAYQQTKNLLVSYGTAPLGLF